MEAKVTARTNGCVRKEGLELDDAPYLRTQGLGPASLELREKPAGQGGGEAGEVRADEKFEERKIISLLDLISLPDD